jgi:hypothetical protein
MNICKDFSKNSFYMGISWDIEPFALSQNMPGMYHDVPVFPKKKIGR